jgi:hypothetical protein
MTTRRQHIEAMLAENPGDSFLRYALALELEKEHEHSESLRRLRELMTDPIPYVPAFFMAGQQLARLGDLNEARQVLRDGIEQARSQNDQHAAAEMSEFLVSLAGS